jgi:two-component system phosphate regulon sensor histidine kinase PhoR
VVAVVRDVTMLRQAERLRRELTANVSHELRTPLTSIKGFAETLLGGAMADEATCRRFLTIIDNEASRLMKLVDDLMDLSRLESHAVAMEPAPVRLDDLVGEAIGRMRVQAERRSVTLRPASLAPETVMADRDRILQVLTNLLDNAIKFTPEGGAVEVSVRRENGGAALTISDSGRGIPEEDLPRIFERFYRVERSRSREEGGTGLGLAIAKHIVDAHGGRISAHSRPGGGSVFTVVLPGASPHSS